MPSPTQVMDTFYAVRFAKLLATKWTDMDAYKLGIIDENGKQLLHRSQLTTQEQKNAYTKFITLVFNVKRLLDKVPFGKSTLGRYGAALALLRDHVEGLVEDPDIFAYKLIEHVNESSNVFIPVDGPKDKQVQDEETTYSELFYHHFLRGQEEDGC